MNVVVIWQSLVVSAYRSFWMHLANSLKGSVTAVVPHKFSELGGQLLTCSPFSPSSGKKNRQEFERRKEWIVRVR